MGRPVVATDHGGARETIQPGTGWLVPPHDPAALATAIDEALALDQDERAAFAKRARAQVAAGYTREIMCARTIEVYEELLFPEAAGSVIPAPRVALSA
jgi:glycosyltransferase involved in cell wall biosynthesis